MIFERVRVFDGSAFIECATVAVEGDRIVAVETCDGAPEQTLLPGIVDCHVHLGFFEPRAVLRGGVTTVRDLGWPVGSVPRGGPDVLWVGPILTAPGGYPARAAWAPPGTACEVAGEEFARAVVEVLADGGACAIKVAQEPRRGPTLPLETLRAICEAARARGFPVTSHCGSLAQLVLALEAGVAELAHGLWSDERIPPDIVEAMVAARMTVVPTLQVDPSPARIDNLRGFVERGGRVVYGTDMGNPPVPGGIDWEELALMRAAGITEVDALAAATARAAEYLGLSDRGRVAPGARADLVLIEGTDLRALARPSLVLDGGVPA